MKKIRFVNGRSVAYIHQDDVTTLSRIRDFVNPAVFSEESILMGECDTQGYYKIEGQEAVNYIQCVSFIPDFDKISKMDSRSLASLADNAVQERKRLLETLRALCDEKKPLTPSDKAFLRALSCVDQSIIANIEYSVIDSITPTCFRMMELALDEQSRLYTSTIVRMADLKEDDMTTGKEEKPHILRKIFGGKTTTDRKSTRLNSSHL